MKDKLKDVSVKLFAKGTFAKSMAKVLAAKALQDKALPEPKVEEQPAVEHQALVVEPPQMAAVVEQPAAADLEAQAKCKLQVGSCESRGLCAQVEVWSFRLCHQGD